MTGEDKTKADMKQPSLLEAAPRVINVGIERFAEDLAAQGMAVQHVQWSPRGAVMGIAVFEGWAMDLNDAASKADAGAFRFEPNHHYDAVGPMTGMTTLSQPVLVVENRAFGNRAYCAINEGLGKVMRFGGNDAEVLDRLRWMREVLGPALGRALRQAGGLSLKPLIGRGLTMGDELHQRIVACPRLLVRP